ncbi:MAG TPA: EAL domain-containing protein [Stellaceae bacterium]|jgi:EAL domain-containing protein (putative c-di-GMP-specific phosphodiesterase class I)|nr:EAL domain-containing protein [Stellaceae bacterium]
MTVDEKIVRRETERDGAAAGSAAAYDRFISFMFGAANLLIETDPRGQISFLGGATQRLAPSGPSTLIGRPFAELFAGEDRTLADGRLARMRSHGSMLPAVVRLKLDNEPATIFGGCALPNGHTVLFLAVTHAGTPDETENPSAVGAVAGLQSPIAFAATVREKFKGTDAGERRLTLVAIDNLAPKLRDVLHQMEEGLFARLANDRRFGGRVLAVGRISDARYGILHDGPLDSGGLRRHGRRIARELAPGTPLLQLTSTAIRFRPGGGRSDIMATAAIYVMARLASGADSSLALLRRASLSQLMVETTGRIAMLRQILQRGDFDLAQQPIINFRSGKVHHTEALIRFRDGGPPNQWIALAEAADIVTELDLAVCRRAIDLAEAMPDGAPPFAMNLSGRSLESDSFVTELHDLLANHPNLPARVMFELTETAVVRDIEAVDRAVQGLRKLGFKMCLDDFGAVATSIHYLRSIKVDYVKIDGLFARSCLRNPNDRSILSHVIALCRGTGAGVIVEMIETAPQAEAFRALGADFAQGYFFGVPAVPESTEATRN